MDEARGKRLASAVEMRFIHLFLIGYFVLIVGVTLALWQSGVLSRIAPIWLGIGAIIAVGLGIMAAVTSGKPTITEERG
jgi:hypothetical protein